MAAARTSLRTVSKKLTTSTTTTQLRNLHMTGPAESPSSILITARTSINTQQQPEDASKRPSPSNKSESSAAPTTRHFNTSRSLKAVGDRSTIDFAYLPDFDPDLGAPAPQIRVPLLPNSQKRVAYAGEVDEVVIRPEISLAAASGTHITAPSAFSDVHDNSAAEIDFAAMADRVAIKAKETAAAMVSTKDEATLKKLWNGLLDDLLGPGKGKAA